MGALDSMRHVVIDSVVYIMQHDTAFVGKIIVATNPTKPDHTTLINTIITASCGLLGIVLGVIFTTKYKKRELDQNLKTHSDNYALLAARFEQDKMVQFNQMTNELTRIQNLKAEYDFNVRKFNSAQYDRVIDMSNQFLSEPDKIKADYVKALNSLYKNISDLFPINDEGDFDDIKITFARSMFLANNEISEEIDRITREYPHIFIETNKKLAEVVARLRRVDAKILSAGDNDAKDQALDDETSNLYQLYEELGECLNIVVEDFKILEDARKEFIKDQISKAKNSQ